MSRRGFTLLEVVVALALFVVVSVSFLPIVGWMIQRTQAVKGNVTAGLLAQEGMEAVYSVFASDWVGAEASFGPGTYYPAVDLSGGDAQWTLLVGSQSDLQARFDREVVIEKVCRDVNTGERSEYPCGSGTHEDANSRLVETRVSWEESGQSKEVVAELLLVNLGP